MAEPEPGKPETKPMIKCTSEGCPFESADKWRVDSHFRMKHDLKFAEKRKAYHLANKVEKRPQGRPPKAMTPKPTVEPRPEAPKSVEASKPMVSAGEAKPKAKSFLDGTRFA
ncbi:MAG: hypothetical protein WA144_15500 [Candidatus Methanoperedens sp.]